MRQQIEARARGERPPLPQPGGVLQEHPRFGGANGTERDWLIVEWNLDAIRRTVLPTLAERHLANRSLPVELRVGAPAGSVRLDLGGPPGMNMSWSLAIPSMESPIEAIVANVRRRNLMIAGAILSMLLGALWLLLRLTRSINRYSEMQMEFVANVSHELRTPLTVIRTAAFNLRGKIAANPQHVERYGKLIQEESEKLTGIVERVLQFAGAKSGGMVRKLEATSIAECIDAALASKSSLLLQAGCILERDVDDNLPPVMADSMAMRGVIENLIQNALKYGMEGGDWLRVAAKFDAHRNELVISVADHGPGIPPEEQGKIFDPFYRGRRAVEEQIHGTGLGLNLVRTIVEAHSGTIQVESKIGAGTEFQIRLPAAPVESFDEFAHTAR
jgi:signal transduction histidine kinase